MLDSIMKRHFLILIIGFAILNLFSCSTNEKKVWVLDFEHVLTPAQITSLDSMYKAHEKITTNEIALVTIPEYGTDSTLERFALNFGNKYGIGKKEKNNGVLIVFTNAIRQTRISTGYGTEKVLKDEIAKKIIDSVMIPYFKNDRIFEGLWEGSKAITTFLEKPENKIMALKNK